MHWLGFFGDEEEAARAHDAEALRRFGPAADLNFGSDSPPELMVMQVWSGWSGAWWCVTSDIVCLGVEGVSVSRAKTPFLILELR